MVRYFYAWTPLVIAAAVFILSAPWLGLIALMVVALLAVGALGALAWAVGRTPARCRPCDRSPFARAECRPSTQPGPVAG
jgi:hypothetical protein